MDYLVATHSALLALGIDDDWSLREHAVVAEGYHFGISTLPAVDGRRRFAAYRGGDSVLDQTTPRVTVYEEAEQGGWMAGAALDVGAVGDVHQMCHANGGIYLTDTKHNTLLYHGLDNDVRHSYTFGGVKRDENHLNSVFPLGNEILVMLHNLKRKESQVAVLKHDLSLGFRLEHVLSLWDENCHNVFRDGSVLLYNASMPNELVLVDLTRDRVSDRVPLGAATGRPWHGHAKGLSASGDHYVVGVSESADRHLRGSSNSCLLAIDRRTLAVTGVIDLHLPGRTPCGNINDIRCISAVEQAQGGAVQEPVDWSRLRLARQDLYRFLRRRIQGIVLAPALRLRRRMRVGRI